MKIGILFEPNFFNVFTKLTKIQLPLTKALELKKIRKKMQEEMDNAEAVKKDMIELYADKNEDGSLKMKDPEKGIVSFSPANEKEINKKYLELMNTEINFAFEKLSPDLFPTFSLEELEMLEDFINLG